MSGCVCVCVSVCLYRCLCLCLCMCLFVRVRRRVPERVPVHRTQGQRHGEEGNNKPTSVEPLIAREAVHRIQGQQHSEGGILNRHRLRTHYLLKFIVAKRNLCNNTWWAKRWTVFIFHHCPWSQCWKIKMSVFQLTEWACVCMCVWLELRLGAHCIHH